MTGDVSFCDDDASCRPVVTGLKFPNGVTKGPSGRIYVPSSFLGVVSVFERQKDDGLTKVDEIETDFPLDNLSVDSEGNLWAAGLTDVLTFFKVLEDPYGLTTPATALRFRQKEDGGFEVEKAVEDGLGEVLPGATTVVHDAKTGRVFMSGKLPPASAIKTGRPQCLSNMSRCIRALYCRL